MKVAYNYVAGSGDSFRGFTMTAINVREQKNIDKINNIIQRYKIYFGGLVGVLLCGKTLPRCDKDAAPV